MTCTLNQTNGGVSFRVAAAFARIASTEQVIAGPKVSSFYPVKYQRHSDSLCKIYATNVPSSDNQNRLLARQYIQDGMELFRRGDVSKSIEYFNSAEQNDRSITPYLWQRGLSYYYNQQYDKASQQFRMDVSVNPYDVEEIVWDIASQLRYNQNQNQDSKVIFPISNQLSLPPGSRDRRRIMVRLLRRLQSPPFIDLASLIEHLLHLFSHFHILHILFEGL